MTVDYTLWSRQRLDMEMAAAIERADAMDQEDPAELAAKTKLTTRKSKNTKLMTSVDAEIARREQVAKEEEDVRHEEEKAARAEHDAQVLAAMENKPIIPVTGGAGATGTVTSRDRVNMRLKGIDRALSTLERFEPGYEASTFVRNIRNLKHLADCEITVQYMVDGLSMKLCPEYLSAFIAHHEKTPIKSPEEFAAYIEKAYESKKSVFQYFAELDEYTGKKGESVQDFAGRVRQDIFDLKTVIKSKWVELKKKDDRDFTGKLETDDVFDLLHGLVVLRHLQNDRECYNYVITRADECLDGGDLANKAAAFKQRADTNDSVLTNTSPRVNYVNRQSNADSTTTFDRSKAPCFNQRDYGQCKRPNCEFDHSVAAGTGGNGKNGQSGQGRRRRYGNGGKKNAEVEETKSNGSAANNKPQANTASGGAIFLSRSTTDEQRC